MDSFTGKLAVVTGEIRAWAVDWCTQLAAQGCWVATCDLHVERRRRDG